MHVGQAAGIGPNSLTQALAKQLPQQVRALSHRHGHGVYPVQLSSRKYGWKSYNSAASALPCGP